MSRRQLLLLIGMWVLGVVPPAFAQLEIAAPAPAPSTIAILAQVMVPGATCVAVHDASSLLFVGHKPLNNQNLSIYRLDARGNPAATAPVRLALPCPDSIKQHPSFPLSLAIHPRLPILYVWQDTQAPDADPVKDFDHLLIYAIKDGSLQLLQSHARGAFFGHKLAAGMVALDPAGQKIYLPNLRVPPVVTPPNPNAAVGYYLLDPQGMPVKPPGKTTPELETFDPALSFPAGLGFVVGSGEMVLFGTHAGPATWDPVNRRAFLSWFLLPDIGTPCFVTGHPKLPFVYIVAAGTPYVFRMEHVDGCVTLLPQRAAVGGAIFYSQALYIARQNKLAIGGANAVHLLKLDAEGRFTAEAERDDVANPVVQAFAYSEKFDRLYVAVEEIK